MTRTRGAIGTPRRAIRRVLDAFRQSLPDVMQEIVLAADPDFGWRTVGSVYQYTRFEALRGMLGGPIISTPTTQPILSELWATSSMFMNDSKEFIRGKEVIEQELARWPKDSASQRMRLAIQDADALEVYCTCFSAVEDDLSQWRGYGDNGAGVCIEFDLNELLHGFNGVGYWLIYGKPGNDAIQVSVARTLISYIHSTIHLNLPPAPVPPAVYAEVREQLTEIWPAIFLAFKHLDFSAEREFRFVYSEAVGRPVPTNFRPGPIVPFVKLGMRGGGQLPIKSIQLGPAASSDRNVRSLRLALEKLGLSHITVSKSDIPYVPQ